MHGALPQEWNSGVGDDVAMSGPGCVNVLACKLGVPSSSKVGIHMDLQALGWVRGQDDAPVEGTDKGGGALDEDSLRALENVNRQATQLLEAARPKKRRKTGGH